VSGFEQMQSYYLETWDKRYGSLKRYGIKQQTNILPDKFNN
jgi:hypothetical protein